MLVLVKKKRLKTFYILQYNTYFKLKYLNKLYFNYRLVILQPKKNKKFYLFFLKYVLNKWILRQTVYMKFYP